MRFRFFAFGLTALLAFAEPFGTSEVKAQSGKPAWTTLSGDAPEIIAHRGASGQRPEHTLEAYELAIEQGAEWIEPDLVMTKDGVLICRHDRYLSTTTDIADRPEFADRKTEKDSNGTPRHDWWAEDFTLAEIKTLKARQPFEGRSKDYDGRFTIPTLKDVIALAKKHATAGRTVGLIPETKQPGALKAAGFDMAAALIADLDAAGWRDAEAPVIIQSFEPEILKALRKIRTLRLVQLVYPAGPTLTSNISLETLKAYSDAVGPNKLLIVGPTGKASDFIERAHALGLKVYPWTFRDDQTPPDGASARDELKRIFTLGADGIFTDFPATAVSVRDEMVN